MSDNARLRLAVAGVGNNISALLQGVQFYRARKDQDKLVGIRRPYIGGLHVGDVDIVAAFDIDSDKIGKPLDEAVFAGTNNYPILDIELEKSQCIVREGLSAPLNGSDAPLEAIVHALRDSGAEVLLYSLPTGLQWAADAYAQASLRAGIGFVNCTPELVARNPETLSAFEAARLPMIGDDLASHIGTSVVHRVLLGLLATRGLTIDSSYQLNLGGNADFQNLRVAGSSKQQSKLNALAQEGIDTSVVEIIPSAGFVKQLHDNKVAYLNIEGSGWGGTPISIDLKLKVQDSSNAAGVIIDLIRIAGVALRKRYGGFSAAAVSCLKSPPGGHPQFSSDVVRAAEEALEGADGDERSRSHG
jgi:myo-inositol-1-phosphate synthase